jgi:HNH endonuclease
MSDSILAVCVRCGAPLPVPLVRRRPRLYCGWQCRNAAGRRGLARGLCVNCGAVFFGRRHRTRCDACRGRIVVAHVCLGCGCSFRAERGRKFCSDACRDVAFSGVCEFCSSPFVRSYKGSRSRFCSGACRHRVLDRRRRAALAAVFVEDVSLAVLIRRDRSRCGLCRSLVDAALSWPNPGSASMDHVIPIGLGGEHSYANTQLAHLFCNLSKGCRVL